MIRVRADAAQVVIEGKEVTWNIQKRRWTTVVGQIVRVLIRGALD